MVYPIRVLVNGDVFQPIDANGQVVEVFTYNGTTYAPLRALAEAYGLEVGYDSQRNIATVNSPKESNIEMPSSFTSAWEVKEKPVINYGNEKIFIATYIGELNMSDFKAWRKSIPTEEIATGAE